MTNPYTANITKWLNRASPEEWVHGLLWYPTAGVECQELSRLTGLSRASVCGVVAAISPMTRWEYNIRWAYNVIKGSGPCAAYKANIEKAKLIAAGRDPMEVLSGDKVTAFYDLLLHGGESESCCIDSVAILAAMDYTPKLASSDKVSDVFRRKSQMARIREAYKQAGYRRGLRPSQAQAIVWTTYRNRRDQ